jgi:hypothetical protein
MIWEAKIEKVWAPRQREKAPSARQSFKKPDRQDDKEGKSHFFLYA